MLQIRQSDIEQLRKMQDSIKLLLQERELKMSQPLERIPLDDGIQSPDRYIFTSETGLPALFKGIDAGTGSTSSGDDVAGSATCEAYKLKDDGKLVKLGIRKKVYNTSGLPIPPWVWFVATRDKFGYWIVDNPGIEIILCPETPSIPGTGE